jgi:hypothetical protein
MNILAKKKGDSFGFEMKIWIWLLKQSIFIWFLMINEIYMIISWCVNNDIKVEIF